MVTNDLRNLHSWLMDHDPLTVIELVDPVIDQLGHDVRSAYVETYWLPILGPSAIWAIRRLVDWLDASSDGLEIGLESFGRSIGLNGGVTSHAPVVRTLARVAKFGMASIGGSTYAVRRNLPPLTTRHLQRLPAYLARSHQLELEAAR